MKKLLLIGLVLLCGCGYTPKSEEIKTEVQTEKETEKKTEKKTERRTEKRTERRTEKKTEKKTEKQTERKTERPTEQKTEKPTEQKTEKPTESSGGHLTRAGGVFYFNGYKETWYSTNEGCGQSTARPIPGKHVDENGIIRDEDGYICVASSDLPFYSVITISLGDAKVYDTGCSHGTIDVYTDW